MAETLQNGIRRTAQMGAGAGSALGTAAGGLVRAVEVADDVPVRRSANGVQFATFGETGLADLDLDRMLEAVPAAIVTALEGNTYYFVPLALRADEAATSAKAAATMVASAWSAELGDAAICHRNVELPHGRRGVFISTRLMGDRFALSFEFFINVAHAFVDRAGVPEGFAALVWQQAVSGVRGETSMDAWESRNMAFGRAPNVAAEDASGLRRRRSERGRGLRSFMASTDRESSQRSSPQVGAMVDEKERGLYLESAFSDAMAIYLLSLALDFDYAELREREYPLLAPQALATRLRWVAEAFPPNAGYEFAVKYRKR